ncbi:MAG: ATP-binding protein [Oscillospiraceae bacterium]|nr:ATP-binding protein [Oscillospiraceae bacterium]
MIKRPEYLDMLITFKEKDLIKVVSGIRRCGKSTLFELYQEYLLENGVEQSQIISINFEEGDYADITDSRQLYNLVNEKLHPDKMNYVFLDEVQKVHEFEKTCDSLYIKKNVDLYITGSNAYLLSGELATLLAGRYIEVKMMPLSFKEYISAVGDTDLTKKYNNYITNGSFPYTLELKTKKERKVYLDGVYTSVVLKDIVARKRIAEVSMLDSVIRFIFDNIGNITSSTNIANTATSKGRKMSVHTVENYLSALIESFMIYKVERYDIKGKQYLGSGHKYYVSDLGFRQYLLGDKPFDFGHILENVVYLELIRRGYEIYVGKIDDAEVDFIAIGEDGTEYYQMGYTAMEPKILERELKPLDSIKDHNPKYLLTMDNISKVSHNGIKQMNALDWLLDIE